MYDDYKDRADFLAVYIREAHPQDEWQMKKNLDENVCYAQPKTLAQRIAIARDFAERFHFPLPLGIDPMTNLADRLYAGWPERLYVIDESGKIVYRGGLGPFNYHPDEVRAWLARRFPPVRAVQGANPKFRSAICRFRPCALRLCDRALFIRL
jgi:Iodothyronine deiodinase